MKKFQLSESATETAEEISVFESFDLSQITHDSENKVIRNAIVAVKGLSKNRFLHQPEVMKKNYLEVLEGALSYFAHKSDRHDPRNLAGVCRNLRWSEEDGTVRCDYHYTDASAPYVNLVEADSGIKSKIGLSIQTKAVGKLARHGNKIVQVVEGLVRRDDTSVDFVISPSAGGRLSESEEDNKILETLQNLTPDKIMELRPDLKVSEASKKEEEKKAEKKEEKPFTLEELSESLQKEIDNRFKLMECRDLLEELLSEANLPEGYEKLIRNRFRNRVFKEDDLQEEIDAFKKLAGNVSESTKKKEETVDVGAEKLDKMQARLNGLFDVMTDDDKKLNVRPYYTIREAYVDYTGDVDVEGRLDLKLSEAFTSQSFPYALANSMTKKLLADYRAYRSQWRKIATVSSAPDFKNQERIQIGYFEDLPDVDPENGNYSEMNPYSDLKTAGAVGQKGGRLTITRKMMINDDMSTIRKVVGRFGRSAARTLEKAVFKTMLENNANFTGDAYGAMFHTSHGNLLASGVSINSATIADNIAAVVNAITAMEAFTEPGSGEKIGWDFQPGDLYLIVPSALKHAAKRINRYEPTEALPNTLKGFFGDNDEYILANPFLTDLTDWYLAVNPTSSMGIDWLEVLFLQGREEPEIFLADNPLVGSMFDFDKLVFKCRFEFGTFFTDFRGAYKETVA